MSIGAVDPATVPNTNNMPDDVPLGIVSYKVEVDKPGDTAEVIINSSETADSRAKWYKYDSIEGWKDYSLHATFSDDRKSVTLQIKDGDHGDADGLANGITVSAGGIGSLLYSAGGGEGGGGGGGCLISTIAHGHRMEK